MTRNEKNCQFNDCFEQWRKSGLRLKPWCKKNGVSYSAMWYKQKKQLKIDQEVKQVTFSEILPKEEKSVSSGVELIIGSVSIRLQKQFDQSTLLSCLQLLKNGEQW